MVESQAEPWQVQCTWLKAMKGYIVVENIILLLNINLYSYNVSCSWLGGMEVAYLKNEQQLYH